MTDALPACRESTVCLSKRRHCTTNHTVSVHCKCSCDSVFHATSAPKLLTKTLTSFLFLKGFFLFFFHVEEINHTTN